MSMRERKKKKRKKRITAASLVNDLEKRLTVKYDAWGVRLDLRMTGLESHITELERLDVEKTGGGSSHKREARDKAVKMYIAAAKLIKMAADVECLETGDEK